jgi:transcriptional regulator with XRE-family HTH domain
MLSKRVLAARIRADLAEKRVRQKEVARWSGRSVKTVERWLSDDSRNERYRPTRAEAVVIAYLTGYPVSRYTGDERDDVVFPLSAEIDELRERLRAAEAHAEAPQLP